MSNTQAPLYSNHTVATHQLSGDEYWANSLKLGLVESYSHTYPSAWPAQSWNYTSNKAYGVGQSFKGAGNKLVELGVHAYVNFSWNGLARTTFTFVGGALGCLGTVVNAVGVVVEGIGGAVAQIPDYDFASLEPANWPGKTWYGITTFVKFVTDKYAHDETLNHGVVIETFKGVYGEMPSAAEILSMTICKIAVDMIEHKLLGKNIARGGDVSTGKYLGEAGKVLQTTINPLFGITRGTVEVSWFKPVVEATKVIVKASLLTNPAASPFLINSVCDFLAKFLDDYVHYIQHSDEQIKLEDVLITMRKSVLGAFTAKGVSGVNKALIPWLSAEAASSIEALGGNSAAVLKVISDNFLYELPVTWEIVNAMRPGSYQINTKVWHNYQVEEQNKHYMSKDNEVFDKLHIDKNVATFKKHYVADSDNKGDNSQDLILVDGRYVCAKELVVKIAGDHFACVHNERTKDTHDFLVKVIDPNSEYFVPYAVVANDPARVLMVEGKDSFPYQNQLIACHKSLVAGWVNPVCLRGVAVTGEVNELKIGHEGDEL